MKIENSTALLQQAQKTLQKARRIVVKIGTNVLMKNNTPNVPLMRSIAKQIAHLMHNGREILLVSSGAIGFGSPYLQATYPITNVALRQACAAIGQPHLMATYEKVFKPFNIFCAQLLLTQANFTNSRTFHAVKNCLNTLLKKKIIPIINENDSVATDEIETRVFGDNDQLSATVAAHFKAKVLVLLTDIHALHDKNPFEDATAKPIHIVTRPRLYINKTSGKTGSALGTGGMKTKLIAGNIAQKNTCLTIITKADIKNILLEILIDGNAIGTIITANN